MAVIQKQLFSKTNDLFRPQSSFQTGQFAQQAGFLLHQNDYKNRFLYYVTEPVNRVFSDKNRKVLQEKLQQVIHYGSQHH